MKEKFIKLFKSNSFWLMILWTIVGIIPMALLIPVYVMDAPYDGPLGQLRLAFLWFYVFLGAIAYLVVLLLGSYIYESKFKKSVLYKDDFGSKVMSVFYAINSLLCVADIIIWCKLFIEFLNM